MKCCSCNANELQRNVISRFHIFTSTKECGATHLPCRNEIVPITHLNIKYDTSSKLFGWQLQGIDGIVEFQVSGAEFFVSTAIIALSENRFMIHMHRYYFILFLSFEFMRKVWKTIP